MSQTGYIFREHSNTILYKTESIQNFNQQLAETFLRKIEVLEGELLSLTDLLMADGDLLQEGN